MIELTEEPIDTEGLLRAVTTHQAGAVVLFVGTVRDQSDGVPTESLDYEAYPAMAKAEMEELESQVQQRWPVCRTSVVHRLGHLQLGEVSVAVAVSSPHRQDAFEAARWLIDRIKQVVPIWKCENGVDGSRSWVHPGLAVPARPAGNSP
jgi:molybdopterin synthase catalytic subunit